MNLGFREKPKLHKNKEFSKISFWTILILDNSLINVKTFLYFLINREEEIQLIYNKIINYCNQNSLSVSAFEKKCGIANGTVGKWKDGGNPSLETLQKIVSATGVPISEWIKENDV